MGKMSNFHFCDPHLTKQCLAQSRPSRKIKEMYDYKKEANTAESPDSRAGDIFVATETRQTAKRSGEHMDITGKPSVCPHYLYTYNFSAEEFKAFKPSQKQNSLTQGRDAL